MPGLFQTDFNKFMVLDCESVGLYGSIFAMGWVLIDREGKEHDYGYECCPILPENSLEWDENQHWIAKNVVPVCPVTCQYQYQVRDSFWESWQAYRAKGAVLCADNPWPVESRFLTSCIYHIAGETDQPPGIESGGPYPLLDISTMIYMQTGKNPATLTQGRLPLELPIHNPLADARQSARLLINALDYIGDLLDKEDELHFKSLEERMR